MSRAVLRPACLRRGDARAVADAMINRLTRENDEAAIDAWVARAETSSPWMTPTTIAPSAYQNLWRLRFFTQTLKLPTLNLVEQLVGRLGCDFVDVGAHVGYFSIAAAAAGARSVQAVEMHEPNWRLLRMNVPQAIIHRAAAGAEEGAAEYFVGSGHSNHTLSEQRRTTGQRASATVVTLDGLMKGASGAPYVVKIDVQGSEAEVLRGHEEGLGTGAPIVIFEAEPSQGPSVSRANEEAFAVLKRHRYRTFAIGDQFLVEVPGADDPLLRGLTASANIVAVAADRFELFESALFDRRSGR